MKKIANFNSFSKGDIYIYIWRERWIKDRVREKSSIHIYSQIPPYKKKTQKNNTSLLGWLTDAD
jgi:hypothetical protein